MRGKIHTEYSVQCGLEKCTAWKRYSALDKESELKKEGWVKTKKYGWVCPVCAILTTIDGKDIT